VSRILTLAVNALPLSPDDKLLLLEHLENRDDFMNLEGLSYSGGILRNHKKIWKQSEQNGEKLKKMKVEWIGPGEEGFPGALREISAPPLLLYYKGILSNRISLSIVGTRQSSEDSLQAAFRLGLEASMYGLCTVSGLASGIDGAVHRGSLAAQKPTLSVLGCGVDQIYPRNHSFMAQMILEYGGAIISEFPVGTPPFARNFPQRNRLISGLSRGTVVVEAPLSSGALITASWALDQGRDVYVWGSEEKNPSGRGCEKLKNEGAPVIRSLSDILEDWGLSEKKTDSVLQETTLGFESPDELVRTMNAELSGSMIRYHDRGYWQ